ncbi:MAG: hypothetical protein R1F52_00645 [Candidatus Nitrosoabyssus spongiisocia]|nr:MAG: hypothetical protein R1F52_00645 [Nitrosopumilaceae archaeon AB1(1)]
MSFEKIIEKIRTENDNPNILSEEKAAEKIEEYANKEKKNTNKKIEIKFKGFDGIEITCSPDNIKYLEKSVEKHKPNLKYLTYERYQYQIKKLEAKIKYENLRKESTNTR